MDVVKLLDLKSRFRLRKCSKQEKSIVDATPFHTESIVLNFFTQPNFVHVVESQESKHYSKITDSKIVIEDVIRLISHPKSTTDSVRLNFLNNSEELQYLMEKLSELKAKQPIKTKKFQWETRFNLQKLPKILSFLSTKHLEEIVIKYPPPLDLDLMNKIMETEQWKCAEHLKTNYHLPKLINMENFVHANSFEVRVFELTTQMFLKAIMKFIARNPPPGSYFSIFADELNLAQMDFLFYDPVPVGEKIPMCDKMLNYTLPTESNRLIICRSVKTVEGVVCRSAHLEEDFKLVRHACTPVGDGNRDVED